MKNDDPLLKFDQWFDKAKKSDPLMYNAMMLGTVDDKNRPNSRMVLLKSVECGKFLFYTNLDSVKSKEISCNSNVSLLFHWVALNKQVRIRGAASQVSDEQADEYFASRPYKSKIGAWASKQSSEINNYLELEKRVANFAIKYPSKIVPRPKNWSGFAVSPYEIEFWEQMPFRLHKRTKFELGENNMWQKTMLYP